MSCFIPEKLAVKVAVKLRSRLKKLFWAPDLQGRGYARFWTCVFKLHLLPSMWPIFVEFCSASSGIRGRKKKERMNESLIKYKSADTMSGGLTWLTAADRHLENRYDVIHVPLPRMVRLRWNLVPSET